MPAGSTSVNITGTTTTVCKGGQFGATITADTATDSTLRNISDPTGLVPGTFLTGANITIGTFLVGVNAPTLLTQFLASTTTGSPTLTNIQNVAVQPYAGQLGVFVTGPNIPASTVITNAVGLTITLSANATATGTNLIKVWSFNPAGSNAALSQPSTGTATGTTYTLFLSTPGILYGIDINTPVATSVITVFDAPVAGGKSVGKLTVPAAPVTPLPWLKNTHGLILNFGLTILTATAASDLTVEFS